MLSIENCECTYIKNHREWWFIYTGNWQSTDEKKLHKITNAAVLLS